MKNTPTKAGLVAVSTYVGEWNTGWNSVGSSSVARACQKTRKPDGRKGKPTKPDSLTGMARGCQPPPNRAPRVFIHTREKEAVPAVF